MRRLHAELELDPPDSLERPLRQRPLGVEQIADHPERAEQHRRVEQDAARDQLLDVARPGVGMLDEEDQEADEDRHRGDAEDQRRRSRTP